MAVEKATAIIKKAYFPITVFLEAIKAIISALKKREIIKNERNIISGNVIDKLSKRSCSSLVLQVG
jgi:hypothetical protein